MRTDAGRKRLIESRQAGKVGRRIHAFYLGRQAQRSGAGADANPFPAGGQEHTCWGNGWQYAAQEAADGVA
jgi:hypothetical protein